MLLNANLHTRRAAITMIPVALLAATMLSGTNGTASYALIIAAALLAKFVSDAQNTRAARPQLTQCVGNVHGIIKTQDESDNMPHAA